MTDADWERAAQMMPRHAVFLRHQITLAARAREIMAENERRKLDAQSEWMRTLWRNGTAKE